MLGKASSKECNQVDGTVLQRMYFIAKWSVQRLHGTGNMN